MPNLPTGVLMPGLTMTEALPWVSQPIETGNFGGE